MAGVSGAADGSAWPWATPDATRQGITGRLRHRYARTEVPSRQVEVAFRRLLVRLEIADPGRWIVKGGVALLLRLDPSRTSDDIDLIYVDTAGGQAVAVRALERAFAIDLGDFFSFALPSAVVSSPGATGTDTVEIRVRALVGGTEWVTFGIDLQVALAEVQAEAITGVRSLTGLAAVDALPDLMALPIARQVAEKTCAMFERHGAAAVFSTRARDLVDIAMIADQVDGIDGAALLADVREEERRRVARGSLHRPLPTAFALPADQVAHWRERWTKATRGAPVSFEDAYAVTDRILTPVLAGTVGSARWSCEHRRWRLEP